MFNFEFSVSEPTSTLVMTLVVGVVSVSSHSSSRHLGVASQSSLYGLAATASKVVLAGVSFARSVVLVALRPLGLAVVLAGLRGARRVCAVRRCWRR